MANERPGYTNWANPWGPMSMAMQPWMNIMRAWTEAFWSMSGAMGGWMPQQGWNAGWSGYPQPSATPAISVQVSSQRAADVRASVTLAPGAECCVLTVGWLKGEGSNPPLKGVSIGSAPGSLRIGVPVPTDQPAGSYCGEIKAPDGRTAGNITVAISYPTASST